jgi:TolB protein
MSAAGGLAERITKGAGMDSRPAWHPDGTRLAFVRDDTRNTDIVEVTDRELESERALVSSPAAELDPAYSPDGAALYYASAETGDLEIYRLDFETQRDDAHDRCARPRPSPAAARERGGGAGVESVAPATKSRSIDADGARRVLAMASIASLARPAVSADGKRVAVPLPVLSSTEWALQLLDVAGGPMTEIVSGGGHPIMPAWSPDGRHVYFSRADEARRVRRCGASTRAAASRTPERRPRRAPPSPAGSRNHQWHLV